MRKLDTAKIFINLFVISLIFIIAMLISLMSGWSITVRIGIFSVCTAIAILYIFREILKEFPLSKTTKPKSDVIDDELLSAVNVMIAGRLKEIDKITSIKEEGLQEMGEAEARMKQAREFSLSSAIANSPEIIIQHDTIMKLALNRAWRLLKMQTGTALQWVDENRSRIITVEGAEISDENLHDVVLDDISAETLRNAAFVDLSKNSNFKGILKDASAKIGISVQIGDFKWGWLLLESKEEKKITSTETRFAAALGRELAASIAIINDWKIARAEIMSVLVRVSDHTSARRGIKKGRGERIAALFESAAKNLGMNSNEIEAGKLSAVLMDLGEIGVPELILEKKGTLSPQELRYVKEHPAMSIKFIREFMLTKSVEETILSHHERWIGGGYPTGLKQEEIPKTSRLLAVCDALEAMLSDRPYRSAYDAADAIVELKKLSGSQFDPAMVEAVAKVHEPWINWILSK